MRESGDGVKIPVVAKLLIVDGNALIHRAFHAMPEWRNRSGEATSGVYGFFSMLLKTWDELAMTHLVVAFDMPEPNFRHAMYVGYQSNRGRDEQLDKDIWEQVEKLRVGLSILGVPVFSMPGYEADDVIGTLCERAKESNRELEIIVLTGDRDLLQLVDERVRVYMPTKGLGEAVMLDRAGVVTKMGVKPEQIVDYKALTGDGSDGYPGVAGIGPKTAVGLLAEFGTFEVLYEAMSTEKGRGRIPPGVVRKLVEGYEMGRMSRELAVIRCDVPVVFDLALAAIPSREKFALLFESNGHPSLKARVLGEEYIKKSEKRAVNTGQGQLF